MREDGALVDQVLLTRDSNVAPRGPIVPHSLREGMRVLNASKFDASVSSAGRDWSIVSVDGLASGRAIQVPDQNSSQGAPRVDYLVDFDTPGRYFVDVLARAHDSDEDSVNIGLDGMVVSSAAHIGITRDGNWNWNSHQMSKYGGGAAFVEVSNPGLHTISVMMREDGAEIAEIRLRRSDHLDRVGVFRPGDTYGSWLLNLDTDQEHEIHVEYGFSDDQVVVGNWNPHEPAASYPAVVRKDVGGGLLWLLDSDKDTDDEFRFLFGLHSDQILVGDFNGDQIDDVAAIRGSGTVDAVVQRQQLTWHIAHGPFPATDGSPPTLPVDQQFVWGFAGDTPVAGDWDGDGISEPGVVSSESVSGLMRWYVPSPSGQVATVDFGFPGDRPIVGDWNGDGMDNVGVVRGGFSDGLLRWHLDTEDNFGVRDSGAEEVITFGRESGADVPVAGRWRMPEAVFGGDLGTSAATLDFGRHAMGDDDVVASFQVHNHGSAPLRLQDWSIPEGIRLVDGSSQSVEPGEAARFSIGLETDVPGAVSKELKITTNDGAHRDITIPLTGYVEDTEAPTGALPLDGAWQSGPSYYDIAINYSDNHRVDSSTIDDRDILIAGPGGFAASVVLIVVDGATAVYRLQAPTEWDHTYNGTYEVRLQPNEVSDIMGNAAVAGLLGSFTVNLPVPDSNEPSIHDGGGSQRESNDNLLRGRSLPNDPDLPDQWAFDRIDAGGAHNYSLGAGVVVAVIDSGVDYTHEDLFQNIWLNESEIPSSIRQNLNDVDGGGLSMLDLNDPSNAGHVTDLNGNGRIDGHDLLNDPNWANGDDPDVNDFKDDLIGINWNTNSTKGYTIYPMDGNGHGTAVAGVAAALAGNAKGTAGIAPKAQIMPLRTINTESAPALSISSWAKAIRYAVDNGAKVVNLSLGVTLRAPTSPAVQSSLEALDSAINYAASKDVLIVTAAVQKEGLHAFDQDPLVSVPGTLTWDNIITVTSSDKDDEIDLDVLDIVNVSASPPYINVRQQPSYGRTSVDIAAPGVEVLTSKKGGGTVEDYGTSYAAPHVAGVAALAYSMFPNLDVATLKDAILKAGDPVTSGDTTPTVSNNRLNARRTLELLFGKWSAQGPQSRFDNDHLADFAVWRPSTGVWHIATGKGAPTQHQFGLPGDVPINGDFNGDGQSDLAVWRRSTGTWWISPSSQTAAPYARQWGLPGDEPVSADYDGDGRSDIAVWRPPTGEWFIVESSDATSKVRQWGLPGDIPVPSDYDGDGRSDIAVWRPSNGTWYIDYSSDEPSSQFSFGLPDDVPVPADYDGDGNTDFAVWRPSTGMWWVLKSSVGSVHGFQWGLPDDIPQPADFNGDRIADFAIWRPSTGNWYVADADSGLVIHQSKQWGLPGDVPVASALRRRDSVFRFDGTESNDRVEFWYDPNSLSNVATIFRDEQFVEHRFLSWFVNRIEFYGGAGDDTMFSYLDLPIEAWGDEGNDVLSGGIASDVLHGGPGDDLLGGGDDSNELYGGEGDDVYSIPSAAENFISDSGGNDSLDFRGLQNGVLVDLRVNGVQHVADQVSIHLPDAQAIEGIWGTAFDDVLIGNHRNNALFGEQGNDHLVGGDGDDLLHGWFGDDQYSFADRPTGNKQIWDAEGVNTLDFSNTSTGVRVDLARTDRQQVTSAGLSFELLRADAVDHIIGSDHDDILSGNWLDNHLDGRGGNDRLNGHNGDDRLWGYHGNDVYAFSGNPSGTKHIWDLEGTNDLDFQALHVPVTVDIGYSAIQQVTRSLAIRLLSGIAVDHVRGTPYSDTITGNNLNNQLDGGNGNDRLDGRGGDDRLWGFHGNDVYAFSGNPSGTKHIWDLEGTNDLDFQSLREPVNVDIGYGGIQQVTRSLAIGLLSGIAVDHVRGTPYSDTIKGNGLDNHLFGGEGDDALMGLGGADRIYGQGGDDYLHGGAGNDYLSGGSGFHAIIDVSGVNEIRTGGRGNVIVSDDLSNTLDGTPMSTSEAANANLTSFEYGQFVYHDYYRPEERRFSFNEEFERDYPLLVWVVPGVHLSDDWGLTGSVYTKYIQGY